MVQGAEDKGKGAGKCAKGESEGDNSDEHRPGWWISQSEGLVGGVDFLDVGSVIPHADDGGLILHTHLGDAGGPAGGGRTVSLKEVMLFLLMQEKSLTCLTLWEGSRVTPWLKLPSLLLQGMLSWGKEVRYWDLWALASIMLMRFRGDEALMALI